MRRMGRNWPEGGKEGDMGDREGGKLKIISLRGMTGRRRVSEGG